MAYKKFFVDNTTCSRRFHISYDDENPVQKQVTVICPFCNATLFTAKDHPPVELARQENLIKTAELADIVVKECNFKDTFSVAPKK